MDMNSEDFNTIDLWVAEYMLAHPSLGRSPAASYALEPVLEKSTDVQVTLACRAIDQSMNSLREGITDKDNSETFQCLLDCLDVVEAMRQRAVEVLATDPKQAKIVEEDDRKFAKVLKTIRKYLNHCISTNILDDAFCRDHKIAAFLDTSVARDGGQLEAPSLSTIDGCPENPVLFEQQIIRKLNSACIMSIWVEDRVNAYMTEAIDRIGKSRRMAYDGDLSYDKRGDPFERSVVCRLCGQ
jgi:hypothetical protein